MLNEVRPQARTHSAEFIGVHEINISTHLSTVLKPEDGFAKSLRFKK